VDECKPLAAGGGGEWGVVAAAGAGGGPGAPPHALSGGGMLRVEDPLTGSNAGGGCFGITGVQVGAYTRLLLSSA